MARLSLPLNPAAELQRLMVEERTAFPGNTVPEPELPPIENEEVTSILHVSMKESKQSYMLTTLQPDNLTCKMPAKSGDLPGNIDVQAAKRVREWEQTPGKTVTNFRLSDALADRIHRYIGEHYKDRPAKQDLLNRAVMLLCYELETGTQLVDFDTEGES